MKHIFLVAIAIILLGGCKKDDAVPATTPTTPTQSALLTDRVGKYGASVLGLNFSDYKLDKAENGASLTEKMVTDLEAVSTGNFKPSSDGAKEGQAGRVFWVFGPDRGMRVVALLEANDRIDLYFVKK